MTIWELAHDLSASSVSGEMLSTELVLVVVIGLMLMITAPNRIRAGMGLVLVLIPASLLFYAASGAHECGQRPCGPLPTLVAPLSILVLLGVFCILVMSDAARTGRSRHSDQGTALLRGASGKEMLFVCLYVATLVAIALAPNGASEEPWKWVTLGVFPLAGFLIGRWWATALAVALVPLAVVGPDPIRITPLVALGFGVLPAAALLAVGVALRQLSRSTLQRRPQQAPVAAWR